MYILLDHVGRVTYPLGDDPLEACLKFCEYVRQCPSDGIRYPMNCATSAFETFQWEVTDGTASELFNLVAETSRKSKIGTMYPRIFEVTVVPRPACWQCANWKADGVFCMNGEREQSSDEPACQMWAPPVTPWKDTSPDRIRCQPNRRQAAKLTGGDWENFQSLIGG